MRSRPFWNFVTNAILSPRAISTAIVMKSKKNEGPRPLQLFFSILHKSANSLHMYAIFVLLPSKYSLSNLQFAFHSHFLCIVRASGGCSICHGVSILLSKINYAPSCSPLDDASHVRLFHVLLFHVLCSAILHSVAGVV